MSIAPYLNPMDLYNLPDPMPSWRWRGRIIPNASQAARSVNFDQLVIEEINLPNGAAIPAKPMFLGGRNIYFPDFNDVPSVQVTIYETDGGDASRELQEWANLIMRRVGPESIYGLPSEYKQSLAVDLYGYASNTHPVMSYLVHGVWPTEPGQWRLAYDSSNRLMRQITLQCDGVDMANRAGGPSF